MLVSRRSALMSCTGKDALHRACAINVARQEPVAMDPAQAEANRRFRDLIQRTGAKL